MEHESEEGDSTTSEENSDYSDLEELSSDEELQEEFSKGNLQPGLIKRVAAPKTYVNNVAGLRAKLAELKKDELDWIERMDVTVPDLEDEEEEKKEGEEEENEIDPEDDFKREMHFLRQAQASAVVGLRKLEEIGVPTQRPDDYFAEMIKTDDHMRRVRESLLSRQKGMEQKEKLRKLRDLKKYGKKVQQEILQKRREEKKVALESVKRFRKGKGERPSFLSRDEDEDDGFPVEAQEQPPREGGPSRRPEKRAMSKKRMAKDQKFGFGGKKHWVKSNTAQSSADMTDFSATRHSKTPAAQRRKKTGKGPLVGGGGRRTRGGKAVRLGKSRRQKMKLKR